MKEIAYYVSLIPDETGELRVSCRDIPEILTWGATESEALAQAADALEVAIAFAMDRGLDVAVPSDPLLGEHRVPITAKLAAKLAVWQAFRSSGISKSELARRMGVAENEARRILNPLHSTKIERLDDAAKALGHRLVVGLG